MQTMDILRAYRTATRQQARYQKLIADLKTERHLCLTRLHATYSYAKIAALTGLSKTTVQKLIEQKPKDIEEGH